MSGFEDNLELNIKANIPVLQVVTYEWQRLYGFCVGIAQKNERELFTWSVVSKLKKWDSESSQFVKENDESDPMDLLEWFQEEEIRNCILILGVCRSHPLKTA